MSIPALRWGVLPLACCAWLAACAAPPRAAPLDPEAVLATVRAEREDAAPSPDRPLTLAEATALLRRANPDIREARAAWQIADAVARTRTPPPNPTVGFGPLFFGGGNILDMATLGYTAAAGWAVPMKNPPRLNDSVNCVRAEAAFARAIAVERMAYLDLRAKLADALLGDQQLLVLAQIETASEAATRVGRDMAEAGQRTALDVRLLELEVARNKATRIAARGRARALQHEVAGLLGRSPSTIRLAGSPLPGLTLEAPAVEAIEAAAIAGHPDLAILRAEYLVAERVLRQEAARANPGLDVGLDFERTQPDNQLGLPLGIELPLFDRNQQGVAEAKATRDAVRARYHARLQRMLGDIATAHARLEAQLQLLDAVDAVVQQASDAAVEAARRGLQAGTVDALSFLTTLRSARFVAVERFEARREVFSAWSALEKAAGVPLLAWPEATEPAPDAATTDGTEEVE